MRFQLKTFLSSIALLLATVKSDDVNLFTSDGVVYSYAVVTSTIAPPSVRVETHYYTTTRVREVTLDNSEVETTTEKIISASEVTSTAQSSSTTSSADETTSSTTTTSTTSFSSSQATQASQSRSIVTLQPESTVSMTSSTNSASSSTISTTSSTSSSSTTGSLGSSVTPYSTVTGTDGKCSVYYEDDEYYSTFYLTDPSQSIDAATTITSTMVVYETSTIQ